MLFGPPDIAWIGLFPCGIAAAVMLACARGGIRRTATWAASIGFGFILGMVGRNAHVGARSTLEAILHPRAAVDWLPWLVLIAVGIAVLAVHAPRSWQRWILLVACVFAMAIPIRLLAGSAHVTLRWSPATKLAVVLCWGLAIAALWTNVALGRVHGKPWLRSGLLAVVALGMAAAVTLSGSFTYGELCGVAASVILGAMLGDACFRLRRAQSSRTRGNRGDETHSSADGLSGAAGPLAVILGGLILLGHYYASLPLTSAALLALAVAAAAGRLPLPLPLGEGWGEDALRALLCLIPLAIAIGLALSEAPSNPYR